MVKWLHIDDDDIEKNIHVVAHLLLFAHLSDNEDESESPKIVAVIHSLQQYHPPQDSLLFFAKGDSLDTNGLDVIEATAIAETAFVLPCIEDQGDDFPFTHDAATYFLVFPPRHQWIDIWQRNENNN
jgi:hypothetical protein